jgi:erythromycin esterase-like protein
LGQRPSRPGPRLGPGAVPLRPLAWIWANTEVAGFATWLLEFNLSTGASVGFYGLDGYSLWESLDRVLDYLARHQPDALDAARRAAASFEPYGGDPWEYGWAARMAPASCEDEVVDLLCQLHVSRPVLADDDPEAELDALQNAEVISGAERYYRTMVAADTDSWNVRDCHMADTLDRLMNHHGPAAKAVVWEHNTHVGDARATDMAAAGMLNVGQVVHQRHSREGVMLVGFAGHHGSVIASDFWGAPCKSLPVPAAPGGTHEDLLHQASSRASLLVFGGDRDGPWLSARRGHRAIGVVYHPRRERYGNWVPTVMGGRYDVFCYFDDIQALRPLHGETARPTNELEPTLERLTRRGQEAPRIRPPRSGVVERRWRC